MAEEQAKGSAPAAEAKKGGPLRIILAILIPAGLAAAAGFGGARLADAASHKRTKTEPAAPEHTEPPKVVVPGPTIALDPFVTMMRDANNKPHAVKLSIAIELKAAAKEEEFKAFVPRLRDATLSYLRGLTYEVAVDTAHVDTMRGELLERFEKIGAATAAKVLITDFVAQ